MPWDFNSFNFSNRSRRLSSAACTSGVISLMLYLPSADANGSGAVNNKEKIKINNKNERNILSSSLLGWCLNIWFLTTDKIFDIGRGIFKSLDVHGDMGFDRDRALGVADRLDRAACNKQIYQEASRH